MSTDDENKMQRFQGFQIFVLLVEELEADPDLLGNPGCPVREQIAAMIRVIPPQAVVRVAKLIIELHKELNE